MCDLTQFMISILIKDTRAENLAKLFMEQVVFSFGMIVVVVVDTDNKFLQLFKEMCLKLDLIFWPLARGSYKGKSVEKYHRFLNKIQIIVGADRDTRDSFAENFKTSQYVWNSAPIDDTGIPRSLAAVGRRFKFPIDVKLSSDPTLNDEDQSTLYTDLRNVSIDSKFATSVLQILIEGRKTAHCNRWNSQRAAKSFHVGDVVKARVQAQSKSEKGILGKLSYQARGPFQIKVVLEANFYLVQRYNNPDGPTRKYKGSELYLLPPIIFLYNSVDTMDQRYLSFSNAPIASPLKQSFKIELYNDQYFPENSKHITNPFHNKPSCAIDNSTFFLYELTPYMPTANSLFEDSKVINPSVEPLDTNASPSSLPPNITLDLKNVFYSVYSSWNYAQELVSSPN